MTTWWMVHSNWPDLNMNHTCICEPWNVIISTHFPAKHFLHSFDNWGPLWAGLLSLRYWNLYAYKLNSMCECFLTVDVKGKNGLYSAMKSFELFLRGVFELIFFHLSIVRISQFYLKSTSPVHLPHCFF